MVPKHFTTRALSEEKLTKGMRVSIIMHEAGNAQKFAGNLLLYLTVCNASMRVQRAMRGGYDCVPDVDPKTNGEFSWLIILFTC